MNGGGLFLNVFGVNAVNDHYYCLLVVAQPQLNNDSMYNRKTLDRGLSDYLKSTTVYFLNHPV